MKSLGNFTRNENRAVVRAWGNSLTVSKKLWFVLNKVVN